MRSAQEAWKSYGSGQMPELFWQGWCARSFDVDVGDLELAGLRASEALAQKTIDELTRELSEEHQARFQLDKDLASCQAELRAATQGQCVCSDCRKTVNNAWRDEDGYHCIGCLAKQRDDALDAIAQANTP